MARPGKSIAKQSEGRAGEKCLPVGGRVRKLRAVGDQTGHPLERRRSELERMEMGAEAGWPGRSLSLAECARSECAPAMRAVRDQSRPPCWETGGRGGKEMGRESSQAVLTCSQNAHGKLCSFDARSEGQPDYSLSLRGQKVGRAIQRADSWIDAGFAVYPGR
jgi:hypothetical protein